MPPRPTVWLKGSSTAHAFLNKHAFQTVGEKFTVDLGLGQRYHAKLSLTAQPYTDMEKTDEWIQDRKNDVQPWQTSALIVLNLLYDYKNLTSALHPVFSLLFCGYI
jgi:hypothetical protein